MNKRICFPALPEIVPRIGLYIQIWFPVPSDSTIYKITTCDFQPNDLLAAIAVNRLFRHTLEPLLWTVYKCCFHPKGFLSKCISRLVTLNNSCIYIRYLELLHRSEPWHLFQQPDLFQFKNCTQLRELKLSKYVDLGWAVQLIEANPDLTLLDWTYPDEVELGHNRCESSQAQELDFSKNLLCTFHLDIDWKSSDLKPIYDMMRAFPALETLIIYPNAMLDFEKLRPILREFCPNLRSIQYIPHRWSEKGSYSLDNDTLITVLDSLTPGNLVDFRMGLDEDGLDDDVMTALLEHKYGLETLELGFCGFEYKPFENVALILRQCMKLKRVSFYTSSQNWRVEDVEDLFAVRQVPWACKGLESLEMRGFYAGGDEFGADDGERGWV
ncbi:hypothetical protein BGX30_000148 [Mortierella sp. GBA39]|nr:hypothetical protein BGX30_000148 [Mortierella sp. GBA39]